MDSELEDLKFPDASSTNTAPYFNPDYIPSIVENDLLDSDSGTGHGFSGHGAS
jgi:hypothetical protein